MQAWQRKLIQRYVDRNKVMKIKWQIDIKYLYKYAIRRNRWLSLFFPCLDDTTNILSWPFRIINYTSELDTQLATIASKYTEEIKKLYS